ncbi:hypothetical protein GCM10009037_21880 [Halarchaeum grantii]|uniref:GAF domain-containing protein n=1 Tax=Halarchaeum grantii TaxID=1193105 RepID=A0A830EYR2_9EURY|nr:GAF domain-containing protein [Halarchaeum grantii]GGL37911.1 hypothetical protein GCM10009037_21880 [Halarchaeum grantii]
MHAMGEISICYVSSDESAGGPTLDDLDAARATPADVPVDDVDAVVADPRLAETDALGALLERAPETPCVVADADADPRDVELAVRTAVREEWTGYPVPIGESERLERLAEYDFEQPMLSAHLDGLTTTARECVDAQVGFVGVVAEQEEEFLTAQGVEWETLERTDAVCSHGIVGDGPLVIDDLASDPRVSYEAITDEYEFEFYAGAPLTSPDGESLGMLCVMDEETPAFDEEDEQALEWLAEQVTRYVERYGRAS